jgi:pheromone shutdown protein TraB
VSSPPAASPPVVPPPGVASALGPVLLVGVAHVLDLDADLDRALGDFAPAAVAIELDADRATALLEREEARARGEDTKASRAAQRRGQPYLLRIWANLQERLAGSLGDIPGAEMLKVTRIAKARGLPLFLIDDPLSSVAPRLLASLSRRERLKLFFSSFLALFIPTRWVEKELEAYEEQRGTYLEAMRQQYPTVTRVLLDERNVHMAERLRALAGKYPKVAAVVGDAHVSGIEQILLQGGVPVQRLHLEALRRKPTATSA